MAKKLDKKSAKESQGPAPKTAPTPEQRQTALRDAAQKIHGLQAVLSGHRAKAGSVAKEITTIMRRLKADFGYLRTDLDYCLRTAALPKDERLSALDTLQDAFRALGVGKQTSFLGADDFREDPVPDTSKAALKAAYKAGYQASEQDLSITACNHPNTGRAHRALREQWLAGHAASQKNKALKLGRKKNGATEHASEPAPAAAETVTEEPAAVAG